MEKNPYVSIVVPVFNATKTIEQTLACLLNQTLDCLEIICVDDGSTDDSLLVLNRVAENDKRVRVIRQSNAGAGVARNKGFEECHGKYTLFFDSDDLCDVKLLEKAVGKLEKTEADIVGFNYTEVDLYGNETPINSVRVNSLCDNNEIFNYKDLPNEILTCFNPVPWNKVYRTEFIRENGLKFEELASSNDITFAAVSMAKAKKITYITGKLVKHRVGAGGTITANKSKNLENIISAVESVEKQIKALDYYSDIRGSLQRFIIDNYVYSLKEYTNNLTSENSQYFYSYIRERFLSGDFENAEDVLYPELFRWFELIKRYEYSFFTALYRKNMVVSLTSYPARINAVSTVLQTIYNQTKKADEIVLWLAEEQFPNGLSDLPKDLVRLVDEEKLIVRFCKEDIKAHKKYLYSFKAYKESLIVTIDDDLRYYPDMLENLFISYLEHPNAVSAMRVHLMLVDENTKLLPYNDWVLESDVILNCPSMQLLATGGAGTLYPPYLLNTFFMDEKLIEEYCPLADDLWLKMIETISDIPVVLARENRALQYIEGSQEQALYHENVNENRNDEQLRAIDDYLLSIDKIGLAQMIIEKEEQPIVGIRSIVKAISMVRERERERLKQTEEKLKIAYQEKSEINAKLQQTYKEKSEINAKLQKTYKEKADRGIIIKEQSKRIKELEFKKYPIRTLFAEVTKVIKVVLSKIAGK